MKVRLSPDARSYVKAEASYLREHSPNAARRFGDNLRALQRHLGDFPKIGNPADEFPVRGIFRLVMGDYLINYRIGLGVIEILTIRHGRQMPPDIEIEDDRDFENS